MTIHLQIYVQVYFEKYVSLFIMSKISNSNIFISTPNMLRTYIFVFTMRFMGGAIKR